MTTLSTVPSLAVPGRKCAITFTKSNSSADYVRVWLTDAPVGTSERTQIEDSGFGRTLFHEGDSGSRKEFVPQRGGKYRLVTQEYTLISGSHGGSYENDPNAAPRETKVGSENSISLTIGQRMTMECGAGQDIAELVLFVFDDTIRATSLDIHGETTPAVKNGSTDRANMALATTSVKSAVTSLADATVSDAIGAVATVIGGMVTAFNAHIDESGVHVNDDTDNELDTGLAGAPTPASIAQIVTSLLSAARQHMMDDNGQGPGTAGTSVGDATPNPYHSEFDYTNLPLFESVSGPESYRALADIWRSYEAHRVSGVHSSSDGTNTLSSLPPLLAVHSAFFSQLAALSPTVPDTQTTGAVQLMTQVGAEET